MDDQTFDEGSANAWIESVESDSAKVRETDIYPRLRSWIDRCSPGTVLDIGCGQGVCSGKISLTGRRYTGVDPSEVLITRAKELYCNDPSKSFVVGNVYRLPFADGAFDAAFAISVWHLLSNPCGAARELARVLRPGGGFLIVTANPNAYSLWTERYAEAKLEGRHFVGQLQQADGTWSSDTLYLHTVDEITTSLQAAELQIESSEEFRPSVKAPHRYQYLSLKGRKTLSALHPPEPPR